MGNNHRLTATKLLPISLAVNSAIAAGQDRIDLLSSFATSNVRSESFNKYELLLVHPLHRRWRWSSGWSVVTTVNASVGILEGGDQSAFIGTLGPGLMLNHANRPVALELGVSPTFISKDQFGDADLGGQFHFTSHIGVMVRSRDSLNIGIRMQHISNASTDNVNPGLNTYMLDLSWAF